MYCICFRFVSGALPKKNTANLPRCNHRSVSVCYLSENMCMFLCLFACMDVSVFFKTYSPDNWLPVGNQISFSTSPGFTLRRLASPLGLPRLASCMTAIFNFLGGWPTPILLPELAVANCPGGGASRSADLFDQFFLGGGSGLDFLRFFLECVSTTTPSNISAPLGPRLGDPLAPHRGPLCGHRLPPRPHGTPLRVNFVTTPLWEGQKPAVGGGGFLLLHTFPDHERGRRGEAGPTHTPPPKTILPSPN